jgi:trk system potassium uptake protein TrkH
MKTGLSKVRSSPEWILVRAFAAAIFLGGLVLCLPISSHRHVWTDPLTAFFTATSATCVTGLNVVDIGSHFSLFGQGAILVMIQAGGLGIMTLGTFLLVMVGRRLGMQNEFVLIDSLGYDRIRGLPSLLKRAVFFTLFLESAGAALITYRLMTWHGQPFAKAFYSGVFHSISAFCNAGFSLYPDNLASWSDDWVLLLTVALLIVLGGIGFLVLYDLSSIRFWRRNRLVRGHLTLHTKIVLKATLILIIAGWILIGLAEWNRTLAPLGPVNKLVVALFHSITARTAGFNVVDMGQVHSLTLFFTMLLMFIGGGPCSTAGGIKITTLAVMLRVMLAMIRGKTAVESHGRTIPGHIVREAQSIFILAAVLVALGFGFLLAIEPPPPISLAISKADGLLFEAVSAFGTVGLSTGITPTLSAAGKWVIMLLMFVGRVGPLTLALVIGRKDIRQAIRLPEEEVIVG